MKVMNKKHFELLNHNEHLSWHECHFSEHSWCENECWRENSSLDCKSIFVNGVSA